jgi:hypothetical protein
MAVSHRAKVVEGQLEIDWNDGKPIKPDARTLIRYVTNTATNNADLP